MARGLRTIVHTGHGADAAKLMPVHGGLGVELLVVDRGRCARWVAGAGRSVAQDLAAVHQCGFGVDAAGDLLGGGVGLGFEGLAALLPLGDILFDLALGVGDVLAVAGY